MAITAARAVLRMGVLFGAAAALTAPAPGQERKVRKCASDDRYQALLQRDPEFRAARRQLKVLTEAFESVRESGRFAERSGPIRIPVVVHVVYHTDAQNISDEQIRSQLAALDADYQMQNPDVGSVPAPFKDRVGNPLVQFALAVRGPDGKATTGITRTKSAETEFLYDGPKAEAVKFTARGGRDGWPRESYLNLWVCPLGGDLLGYASFPGEDPALDGVVINYTAFGTTGTAEAPFDKGRTATHEVGHWLNLFHIWGDDRNACTGSDQVRDTPNQASQNTQCPTFPHRTCGNRGTGDMLMNYMDYTDDACMFAFTKGQVRRMEATLSGARLAITTSQGLTQP
jgi:hypothetical protein